MRTVFAAFTIVTFIAAAAPVHAQRAVQVSPDGANLLISKPLNGQQWSIVVNFDAHTIAGTVFNFDGSDPQFVYCTIVEPVIANAGGFFDVASVTLDCSGGEGCSGFPCTPGEWTNLGTVQVIGSFFLPAGAVLPVATPARTPTPTPTATTPTATILSHSPACGSAQCDLSWCGIIENQCPADWASDTLCDCGCQFTDPACFATPAPGGGGDPCCRHCTTGIPCGDTCISASKTCHTIGGCACF